MPDVIPQTPDPELPIRLIALDIDGTIIGDDLDDRRRGRSRRSAAAMDRDVAVSLVTGRMVSSAMRFAARPGAHGPLVGYQGGLIRAMPRTRLAAARQAAPCTRRCRPRSRGGS